MERVSEIAIDYYYDYAELETALKAMAEENPKLCRLQSIGKTYEGRNVYLLEITDFDQGLPEEKPGYYAEACTHAEEFCGTNAALLLAKELLLAYGRDGEMTQLLKDVVFYIVPRVNPDGVDRVMKTGLIGVANGKYSPEEYQPFPGLCPADLNGDGIVAQMRVEDPDGEWKVSEKDPRLMVLRKPDEQQGTFYRMYPEGIIQGDSVGFPIPRTRDVNLNRNYPVNWLPENLQYGACEFPLSEPETRAVAHFIYSHPNIAGVISYHTNAGAIMRPFSGKGDENFLGADLALYNYLGAMGKEDLGYEVMSTFGGFTPDKSRVRGGTLSDWTFEMLGIPSFMLELWNVYDAAGTERPKEFHFAAKDEDKDLAILQWADKAMGEKAYVPWTKVSHPQLGTVEVGGWNWIYVERNPPESYLEDLAGKAASFTIKLAKALPKLAVRKLYAEQLADTIYKVGAVIRNSGYLPTYLTSQAMEVKAAKPVRVDLKAPGGNVDIVCCTDRGNIGHLAGRFGRDAEWSRDRAMWSPTEKRIEWIIRAKDPDIVLEVEASSPRCGTARGKVTLSDFKIIDTRRIHNEI